MTIRHILELETISFLFLTAVLSSLFVWQSNRNLQEWFYASLPYVTSNKTETVITPVANRVAKIDTASQISPDGVKLLTMKKTHNTDGTFSYVFTTSDGSGTNEKQIYTKKVTEPESMAVPFNAWSPDDKYVFIQKNGNNALVFKATGEEIAGGELYFDVEEAFVQKGIKNRIDKVTGWASPTLVIVNTVTPEDEKGPSYWFEVPSKAIIPLASQF
ncbi:MAG: hypothetical protein HYV39_02435 [Candidatus Levybacteria bacterium]|nr:hypothetical protein [Candidatus Levybacteria bacterium]